MKHLKRFLSKESIVATIFFMFLAAVSLCTIVRLVSRLDENKALNVFASTKEDASFSDALSDMTSYEESRVNENIYWNEYFSVLGSNFQYLFTGKIESLQVSQGADGWLFYKSTSDGDSVADFEGTKEYSTEVLEKTADRLTAIDTQLSNAGVKFIFLVLPNKENVYADKVTEFEKVSDTTRTDKLVAYLRENTDVTVVYPKEELIEAAKEYQVYYKYDTHWNNLGAYVGYQALLETLYGTKGEIDASLVKEKDAVIPDDVVDDLSTMIGMTWKYNDEKLISYGDYRFPNTLDRGVWYECDNVDFQYEDSILVIGDSFRTGMIPFFEKDFARTRMVHRDSYDPFQLQALGPTVVVMEVVERYAGEIYDFDINTAAETEAD